jgi:hypothetical protein
MSVLERLLRGSAALVFLALGGFALAIANLTVFRNGWTEGYHRIVERGPRAEWMLAVAGAMLAALSVAVMTKRWKLRAFVPLPAILGFTLIGTVVLPATDKGTIDTSNVSGLGGVVLVVIALAPFFVGAVRSGE